MLNVTSSLLVATLALSVLTPACSRESGEGGSGGEAPSCTPPPKLDGVSAVPTGGPATWSRAFGGAFAQVTGVAATPAGEVILAGTATKLDAGGGPLSGVFLVEVDQAGNHLWSRSFVDATAGGPVGVDANGNIVVAVVVIADTVDFGKGPVANPDPGLPQVALVALDATGATLWSQWIGLGFGAHALALDPMGNIVVTMTEATVDPFTTTASLTKYDAQGTKLWSRDLGDDSFVPLALDATGDAVVLSGGLLRKLDPTGAEVWSGGIGNLLHEHAEIAIAPTGTIVVVGSLGKDAALVRFDDAGDDLDQQVLASSGAPFAKSKVGGAMGRTAAFAPSGRLFVAGTAPISDCEDDGDRAAVGLLEIGQDESIIRNHHSPRWRAKTRTDIEGAPPVLLAADADGGVVVAWNQTTDGLPIDLGNGPLDGGAKAIAVVARFPP